MRRTRSQIRRLLSLTTRGPWGLAARIAAGLLISTILFDAPDAFCDPARIQPDGASMSAPSPADADACDEVCVADCFCCSTPVPAVEPALLERPEAPATTREVFVDCTATGFSILPEHIPIARS